MKKILKPRLKSNLDFTKLLRLSDQESKETVVPSPLLFCHLRSKRTVYEKEFYKVLPLEEVVML